MPATKWGTTGPQLIFTERIRKWPGPCDAGDDAEERLAEAGGCTWGSPQLLKATSANEDVSARRSIRGAQSVAMIQASWLDPMSPGGSRISPAPSPLLGSHRQASAIPAFKTELQERCWESYAPAFLWERTLATRRGRNGLVAATSPNCVEPGSPAAQARSATQRGEGSLCTTSPLSAPTGHCTAHYQAELSNTFAHQRHMKITQINVDSIVLTACNTPMPLL